MNTPNNIAPRYITVIIESSHDTYDPGLPPGVNTSAEPIATPVIVINDNIVSACLFSKCLGSILCPSVFLFHLKYSHK
jgi:hypothetical protein